MAGGIASILTARYKPVGFRGTVYDMRGFGSAKVARGFHIRDRSSIKVVLDWLRICSL
jgi:hypothetical protein